MDILGSLRLSLLRFFGKPRRHFSAAIQRDIDAILQFPKSVSQTEASYIEDHDARFKLLHKESQAGLSKLPKVRQRQYGFILDVLEANMVLRQGNDEDATAKYRAVIREVETIRADIIKGKFQHKERRNLDYFSIVLAILHNNIGTILSKTIEGAKDAEGEFEQAITLQPSMAYIRQTLAEHYVRHRNWPMAEQSFRDAYRCIPSEKSEKTLNIDLSHMSCEHAQRLKDDEQVNEAVEVLDEALSLAHDAELSGWEGRIHSQRARCFDQQGLTGEAAEEYLLGSDCYQNAEMFSSASYLIEERGDLFAKSRSDEAAHSAYVDALDLADRMGATLEPGDDQSAIRVGRARLLSKKGLLDLAIGNTSDGESALNEAQDLVPSSFRGVVSFVDRLLDREDLISALKLHLVDQIHTTENAKTRRELAEAILQLYRMSEQIVTEDYGVSFMPESQSIPIVVTPIILEIDSRALFSSSGPEKIIDKYAPEMRKRVEDSYGVRIPGIRLMETDVSSTEGNYFLAKIHEIPRLSGSVPLGQRAFVGSARILDDLDIFSRDPINAEFVDEGYWISTEASDRVIELGHTVWDPLEYIVRNLESLLVANLVEFVGHQEAENQLDGADLNTDDRYFGTHMNPFSKVVRRLVADRVPVTDTAAIYGKFLDGMERGLTISQIVAEIRSMPTIESNLWGNDGSYRLFQFGPKILREIDDALLRPYDRSLAMESEVAQAFVATTSEVLSEVSRVAVVVPRSDMTALVRTILEIKLPDVPVLSLRELQPGLGADIEAIIESPSTS